MATLIDDLLKDLYDSDFFQIVWMLEELIDGELSNGPWGNGIHFLPDNSFSCPSNEISHIKKSEESLSFLLTFMGLAGTESPLPAYFTEYIARGHENTQGWYDFLTIFNHRIYDLLYQAWKKYCFIKNITGSKNSDLKKNIASLAGIPNSDYADLDEMLKNCRYFLWGRSTVALRGILIDFLKEPMIHIEEFVPETVIISNVESLNGGCILGKTAVLGTTFTDYTGKFRIMVGPVTYDFYEDLISGKKNIPLLMRIIYSFLSEPLQYEIVVLMKKADLKPVQLGNGYVGLGRVSSLSSSTEFTGSENVISVFSIKN